MKNKYQLEQIEKLRSDIIKKFGHVFNEFNEEITYELASDLFKKKYRNVFTKSDEDLLFFAFRYALGRRTGVVDFIVGMLTNRWEDIKPETRVQIQQEILNHEVHYGLGDQCDKDAWNEILSLKVKK